MTDNMRDMLLKSASLCREAAQKLRDSSSPEKEASEIVASMLGKGLIDPSAKETYAASLASTPENLSKIATLLEDLPVKTSGELGTICPSLDSQINAGIDQLSSAARDKFDAYLSN